MVNGMYVNWLVSWVKKETINIQTGLPFVLNDIIIPEYRGEVEDLLNAQ
ncbi:hypothetical protein Dhaf_1426 [Desulfitobacterium hafniense DCB-2]|uniref:Uncharacterized protein n=2 Tax=root TaxID=1 RepID=B8FNV6_DESHD|nr:hypothetical protein [Desulfitobacterium hafniense]ACL19481.1 hypothetical protein Dhaf_1426 [Desulfitobacterium hafniense DCB-2]MEA5023565.1 hypothetical protein [Desulfitobacterium hafniense]